MTSKQQIIEEARFIYAIRYGNISEAKGCLFWAAAFNEAARNAGLNPIFQAGSAQFQFRSDDGKRDTHFSYMFEPGPALMKFRAGELPEMHVWSYVKSTDEIVDLSTAYQPAQAKELCDYEWEREFYPPPYLWVKRELMENLAPKFVYQAEMMATMLAVIFHHEWERNQMEGDRVCRV